MSRSSSPVTGWALAATGAVLAIAAVAVVLLFSTSGASAASGPTASARPAATASTISLASTGRGKILVGPGRHTLYAYSRDGRDHDVCQSVRGCLSVWPALMAHGTVHAGSGVRASLLGTIAVHGGRQVTYAGHPLYTYTGDDGPATTDYIGVDLNGGTWPALNASGGLIR